MEILSIFFGPLLSLIDKIVPDKSISQATIGALKTEEGIKEIAAMLGGTLAEYEDAKQGKMFSRWHDIVGWVCALAFAYNYLVEPILVLVLSVFHIQVTLLHFDMSTMLPLLFGILGIHGINAFSSNSPDDSQRVSPVKLAQLQHADELPQEGVDGIPH